MRTIVPTFSHINLKQKKSKQLASQSSDINHLDMVLESEALLVNTYDELVKGVAQILHRYRNMTLFYRGVSRDYKIHGKTTILPSIFRKGKDDKRLNLKDNFILLEDKVGKLKKNI